MQKYKNFCMLATQPDSNGKNYCSKKAAAPFRNSRLSYVWKKWNYLRNTGRARLS